MKEKSIEEQRAKPRTPIPAIEALIGDEETDGEKRRENKERNREQVPNPATLDPLITSYDLQGTYGEHILVTSPAHKGKNTKKKIYIYIYIYIYGVGGLGSIVEGSGNRTHVIFVLCESI